MTKCLNIKVLDAINHSKYSFWDQKHNDLDTRSLEP